MARTNHTLPTESSNATEIRCKSGTVPDDPGQLATMQLSDNWNCPIGRPPSVQLIAAAFERSVGSVWWFVRAIANRPHLWHGQTMRFLRNVQTQLQSVISALTYVRLICEAKVTNYSLVSYGRRKENWSVYCRGGVISYLDDASPGHLVV